MSQKRTLAIAMMGIVAVGAFFAGFEAGRRSGDRYQMHVVVTGGYHRFAYRINKTTGETWIVRPDGTERIVKAETPNDWQEAWWQAAPLVEQPPMPLPQTK